MTVVGIFIFADVEIGVSKNNPNFIYKVNRLYLLYILTGEIQSREQ